MNPPGMTDSSSGGADGGGPRSSSRICLQEQRGGYGAGRGDGSPGKRQPRGRVSGTSSRAAAPRSGGGASRGHRAGCRGPPVSARLLWGCCGEQEEKHQEEKPRSEAPRFPHPGKGACRRCPTPRTTATATGGTVPAAASHEAVPGITAAARRPAACWAPRRKPAPLSAAPSAKGAIPSRATTQQRQRQTPQTPPEAQPRGEPRALSGGRIARTRTVRLRRDRHSRSSVRGEARGQPGCSASPRPARSPPGQPVSIQPRNTAGATPD